MIKRIIKKGLDFFNLEVTRKKNNGTGYDSHPIGHMPSFLQDIKRRGLQARTLLDIGANSGEWTSLFKSIYPNSSSYMVEPLIECETVLKNLVKKYPDCHYYLFAVGSRNEQRTITIWDDLYGSSLLPENDERKKNSGKQRLVEVITVDDLLAKNKIAIPEIVKIDIQGFELEALKGASSLFGKTELFILEVSLIASDDVPGCPELFEIVDFMFKKDYVAYDFPGFLRRPLDGALGQCDIAFVKKDGQFRSSKKWN